MESLRVPGQTFRRATFGTRAWGCRPLLYSTILILFSYSILSNKFNFLFINFCLNQPLLRRSKVSFLTCSSNLENILHALVKIIEHTCTSSHQVRQNQ